MGLLAGVPRQGRAALVAVVAACGLAALAAPQALAAGPFGQLHQLAGAAGCWSDDGSSEDGAATCANSRGLQAASDVLFSPDGRHLYVASQRTTAAASRHSLTVYGHDPLTGGLSQLPGAAGCVTRTGTTEVAGEVCGTARALGAGDGAGLAISNDGRSLYLASRTLGAVLAFSRDSATGDVVQLPGTAGCISANGTDHTGASTCADGQALGTNSGSLGPAGMVLSPDDRFLYVSNTQDRAILTFRRDPSSGALTQLPGHDGCMSVDGASSEGAGLCRDGRAMGVSRRIAIRPDGRFAFAPNSELDGLAVLFRDPASGVLTQTDARAGCVTLSGYSEEDPPGDTRPSCLGTGRGVDAPYDAVVSPNGLGLYVSGNSPSGGVAIFQLPPDHPFGLPVPLPGASGCVTSNGTDGEGGNTCTNGRATGSTIGLELTPDGQSLYAVSRDLDTLAAFSVDPASSAITQLPRPGACLSQTGAGQAGEGNICVNARAFDRPTDIAISPDGLTVAVVSTNTTSVSLFRRELAPSCTGASVSTAHATAVRLPLTCTDVNGDAVTRTIARAPGGGTLSAIDDGAGAVVYVPNPGFTGTDTVVYRGGDGMKSSPDATVTIAVAPPPPPPPGPPPPPPLPVDKTAPACRVVGGLKPSLRKARSEGFDLKVRCDDRADVRAEIRVAAKDAKRLKLGKKTVVLFRGTVTSRPGRTTAVTLEPVAKVTKKLRKIKWSRLRNLRPTARVIAADRAGNRATVSAKLRWKK